MPAWTDPSKHGLELSRDVKVPARAASGAPEGERAPQADELRKLRTLVCGALPRPRRRRVATRVGVARTLVGCASRRSASLGLFPGMRIFLW